jgi:hypothetical protein
VFLDHSVTPGCGKADVCGMADFIPTQDADFMQFALGFASGVSSSPWTYGVSQGDAQTISNAVKSYVEALGRATTPLTRTPGMVNAKDTARNAARNLIRMYANQFRANMGIADQALIDIGLRRRPTSLSKRTCPMTSPALFFQVSAAGGDQLRFRDSLDILAKTNRKPYGAERLELYVVYGHKPVGSSSLPPRERIHLGAFRKNPILVPHDPLAEGKEPTYWARWAGHNDDVGPWSLPTSLKIAREKAKEEQKKTSESGEGDQSFKLAA